MCRYAWHNYRDHFACFDCRKAFKYWQWEEIDEVVFNHKSRLQRVPRQIVCPDCTQPMVDMGLDFKAPRKDDKKAWSVMRALHDHGFDFRSCGCSVGFKPPDMLREVPAWIEEHRKRTKSETVLASFAAREAR
jgi:hypothetical protein